MLERLSGSINEVVTGVHLYSPQKKYSFAVRTKVFFKELTADEIEYYVSKYQPYDKAGAYGIQEWIGMIGVEKIEGCFYNVMGLDRKSTRLNSSHVRISYAVFCLKKKRKEDRSI